jgi:NAD(P)H-hydrate epimerase
MAKGGSGDVLSGMITAFLAQGYPPVNAAKLAVYLHGLAGDIATESFSELAVTPSNLVESIGKAYLVLTNQASLTSEN